MQHLWPSKVLKWIFNDNVPIQPINVMFLNATVQCQYGSFKNESTFHKWCRSDRSKAFAKKPDDLHK